MSMSGRLRRLDDRHLAREGHEIGGSGAAGLVRAQRPLVTVEVSEPGTLRAPFGVLRRVYGGRPGGDGTLEQPSDVIDDEIETRRGARQVGAFTTHEDCVASSELGMQHAAIGAALLDDDFEPEHLDKEPHGCGAVSEREVWDE
jgi:hypothetical protein